MKNGIKATFKSHLRWYFIICCVKVNFAYITLLLHTNGPYGNN